MDRMRVMGIANLLIMSSIIKMRCHTQKEQAYTKMNNLCILPFVFCDVGCISGVNGLMVLLVVSKLYIEKVVNVSWASCKMHDVPH